MRRIRAMLLFTLSMAVLAPAADAGLLSKTYEFRKDVTLEIGTATEDGLRLDSLHFSVPGGAGTSASRTRGLANVVVAVSNTSNVARRTGIAVALFDAEGRLVGVASGGSRVVALKPGRQKSFKLVFDDVSGLAASAKTFQVTVEARE